MPGWLVVFRDMVIFSLGILIIARQAGIFFAPPASVSIELLTVGALMCNIPGILHVIAWRSGVPTDSPFSGPDASHSVPHSAPSPVPSSDGEA